MRLQRGHAGYRAGLRFEPLETRQLLAGDLVISEVLASNDNDLRDEDRNRTDWIEVLNRGAEPVNLDGWFLTDDAQDLSKWRFPQVELQPNQRLVVFASDKDRAQSGAELHTNFRLSAAGDYLALVEPDGSTVAFQFAPEYPPQAGRRVVWDAAGDQRSRICVAVGAHGPVSDSDQRGA